MPRGRGQARAGARRSARGDTSACSEDDLGGSAAPASAKRAGVALAGRLDSRKKMRGRVQDSADAADAAAEMIAAAARGVPAPAAGLHTRGDGMDTANEGGDSTADAQGTGSLETEGPPARPAPEQGGEAPGAPLDGSRRVESARGTQSGSDVEPDAGAADDGDEFGGAVLARAAKGPRTSAGQGATAAHRRQSKARESTLLQQARSERKRQKIGRRLDMIKDPVMFARLVVWGEGKFDKSKGEWVIKEEYAEDKLLAGDKKNPISPDRHHERVCGGLGFWTGAKGKGMSREDVTPMHSLVLQMAATTMGEDHIHRKDNGKTRSPWWMCIVAAAHDLGLLGTTVMH